MNAPNFSPQVALNMSGKCDDINKFINDDLGAGHLG
jgi:hypothetical protein